PPQSPLFPYTTLFRSMSMVEIVPGIRLVANRDPDGAFPETPELSLVLDTPDGQVVLVGCSHPGIERILESAHAGARSVAMLVGRSEEHTSELQSRENL